MENFDSYIGQSFDGKYTVINVIGAGEYSVVFGAYDTAEDRTVAIKILRPEYNEDPVVSERFATEVNILSLLSHPNIVKIYETRLDAPVRYFAMEYIEGITLKKHILSRGALDTEEILFFSRQILSALEEVHDKGVVHSDIKPQNIVVLGDGSIRLMDFGIATLDTRKPLAVLTEPAADDPTFGGIFSDDPLPENNEEEGRSELAVGTVHYVSPEQAEGKALDHLSDIYSFGIMLYEMTTGILPFFGESAQKIATMHVRLQPIPPSHLDPSVPEGLERIILRAMEKLPFARFPSASAMREELERFAEALHNPPLPEEPEEEAPATPLPFLQKCKDLAIDYWHGLSIPSLITGVLCALLVTVVIGLGILSDALLTERREPTRLKVPDLVNHEYSAAMLSLDPSVYRVSVTFVDDDARQGRIIAQSPKAGSIRRLKDGEATQIELTVACRSLPPTMPDLRRMSYGEIAEILRAYDCEVTVVEEIHAYIAKGEIIATKPAAGEQTTHGITVYVSAGWRENE